MHAVVEDLLYDRADGAAVLLFGDDAGRRARLGALIAARGGRLLADAALADAGARLDARAAARIVVVDAAAAPDLDALLARVGAAGAARRIDALVLFPPALLDRAGTLLGVAGIALAGDDLDDPALDEAIAALLLPPPACVAEEGEEERRRRLAALGEDAGRIARALAAMAAEPSDEAAPAVIDPARELAFLRAEIRRRRLRERCFDAGLFADPAWDMLLDLRVAALEGRRVAVSSLCIAAAVPPTTALRWIGLMTTRGLLERAADPADARRAFVALGAVAGAAMARFAALALAVGERRGASNIS